MPVNINEPSGLAILQLNVEGLTRSKCEVIQLIATKHSASVILLQETQTAINNTSKLMVSFSSVPSTMQNMV